MFPFLCVAVTIIVLYSLISSVYHIEYIRLKTKDTYYDYSKTLDEISKMQKQISFFKAPLLWILDPSDIRNLEYIGIVLGVSLGAQLGLMLLSAFFVLLPFVFVSLSVVLGIIALIVRLAHSKATKGIKNG